MEENELISFPEEPRKGIRLCACPYRICAAQIIGDLLVAQLLFLLVPLGVREKRGAYGDQDRPHTLLRKPSIVLQAVPW